MSVRVLRGVADGGVRLVVAAEPVVEDGRGVLAARQLQAFAVLVCLRGRVLDERRRLVLTASEGGDQDLAVVVYRDPGCRGDRAHLVDQGSGLVEIAVDCVGCDAECEDPWESRKGAVPLVRARAPAERSMCFSSSQRSEATLNVKKSQSASSGDRALCFEKRVERLDEDRCSRRIAVHRPGGEAVEQEVRAARLRRRRAAERGLARSPSGRAGSSRPACIAAWNASR